MTIFNRSLLMALALAALMLGACGSLFGDSGSIERSIVDSVTLPETIVEGEALEVELGIWCASYQYTFSRLEQEVNQDENIVILEPFTRRGPDNGIYPQSVTVWYETASIEGLTAGEWTIRVKSKGGDIDRTVTVLPPS